MQGLARKKLLVYFGFPERRLNFPTYYVNITIHCTYRCIFFALYLKELIESRDFFKMVLKIWKDLRGHIFMHEHVLPLNLRIC